MSNEQAKRDYLEALAEYESHINAAAYLFLIGKGFSERKIRKNPDLINPYVEEFTAFIEKAPLISQLIRESRAKMRDAEARL